MSGQHIPLADCRDCGEPIRFVRLDTGTNMPINPGTNPAGTVAAMKVGQRLHGFVITRTRIPGPQMARHTPHAATCTASPARSKAAPEPTLFDAPTGDV